MSTVILALLLGLLIVFIFLRRSSTRRIIELSEKLPGPKPLPIIGNALEFGFDSKGIFLGVNRLVKEYGPIVRMWIGADLFVVLSGAKYLEHIFGNSKVLDKAVAYKYLQPWLGTGLLTGTGNKWRVHRKLITPTFHFKILEKFVEDFNSNGEILIEKLSKFIGGPEFDVFPHIALFALDVISETAMGVKVNAQEDSESEYVNSVKGMCEVVIKRSFWPWYQQDRLFSLFPLGKKQTKWLAELHGTTRQMIAKRKQHLAELPPISSNLEEVSKDEKRKLTFLDLLLIVSNEEGNKSSLTDEEIREEVDTFMFEGHDTTAIAMSFACYELGRNQEVQERLVTEIKQVLQDRTATYQELLKMPYLDQVLKETMRLYPSVPMYGRGITEELRVGDYVLPVGCNVLINAFMAHRDPTYFPDPLVFNPDRFSAENSQGRHPFAFIPFSAGARNCVGQKFAMVEMKATLCKILRHYKILGGSTPLDLVDDTTLKSYSGVHIKLERREWIV